MNALNSALCRLGDHWTVDGDYMCCRSCKRNVLASYDLDASNPPMRHAEDCKRKVTAAERPWITMRTLMAGGPW